MAEAGLRGLSEGDLVARLKKLQRDFDAGSWSGQDALRMLAESKAIRAELRSRGLSEVKIEWLLCDKAMA